MAATFDTALRSDKDWVRLLTADTDVANARLQDETIAAILKEEGNNRYYAAATALEVGVLSLHDNKIMTKIVDNLHLTYGGKTSEARIQAAADAYRVKGATLASTRPVIFEVFNGPGDWW